MSTPRFISIDFDRLEPFVMTGALNALYIGLLKKLPSEEEPNGIEVNGMGYQRQFYEPNDPKLRLEWGPARGRWGHVIGFGVYRSFSPQESDPKYWLTSSNTVFAEAFAVLAVPYEEIQRSIVELGYRPALTMTREPTFR
jgi:hypothetical protein